MLAMQLAAAIPLAQTSAVLDALSRATWSGLAGGHLSEAQAQEVATALEARRGEFRRPKFEKPASDPRSGVSGHVTRTGRPTFFARARLQLPPDRAAALARRRRLAASGPMPPRLAAQFTTGELAVLRVVADEVRDKGMCDRTYAEMAARAGVCRRTALNAIRRAGRLGFVHIEERPRPGRKHLANLVRIASKEWRMWIDLKGRGGARTTIPPRGLRMAATAPSVAGRSPRDQGLVAGRDRVKIFGPHGHQDSTRGFSR
jgi:hypothetical protein